MNRQEYKYISSWVDKNTKKLSNWNKIIWNLAEPAWREYESSKLYIEILKKNNFKIPSVNSENITLEYKDFNKLLFDVKSMQLSYYYNDKKNTFERKKYFKKLEENFYKNSKGFFVLTSDFFVVSGWKEHSSQQKPLKPGEAKNRLSKFLE